MTNTDDIKTSLFFVNETPFVFFCVDYIRPGYITKEVLEKELYPAFVQILDELYAKGYDYLFTTFSPTKEAIKFHKLFNFNISDKGVAFMQTCF